MTQKANAADLELDTHISQLLNFYTVQSPTTFTH
jgi:hypothetical protein